MGEVMSAGGWRALAVCTQIAALTVAAPAMAQTKSFNIPAQDASTGIPEFARQAGIQILVAESLVHGKHTASVQGDYSVSAGLTLLLAGTNLGISSNDGRTITLRGVPGKQSSIAAPASEPVSYPQAGQQSPAGASAGDRNSRAVAGRRGTATATAHSSGLEEVVVTARRRQESEQAVPISITAITQQELERNNIQSIGDLQHFVPSLTMSGPYRDLPIVSIRGQGGFTPGGIPSVIMYLNEVPLPTSAQAGSPGGTLGGNGLFFDLESVQVLKGPQGTLFGRNTTGGAILLQSKRPENDFGGHVQLTAGDYGDKEVDAAINVPIVDDRLLLRAAVNAQDRDGFTKTLSTPDSPGGKDLDNTDHFAARVTVRWLPTDDIRNDVIANHYNSKTNGTSQILSSVASDPHALVNLLFPGVSQILAQQQALGIRTQVPSDVNSYSSQNVWSVTDVLQWDITDNLTFRNIASYSKAKYSKAIDGDGTILPIFDPIASVQIPYTTEQYSEEAQLQGRSLNENLSWTLGYFYLDSPYQDGFTATTNHTLGGTRFLGYNQSDKSTALYAQGTYNLSSLLEGLSFTAGFRYTWDTIGRATSDIRSTGTCTSPYANAQCVLSGSGGFQAPTWTVGLDYKVLPQTLLYITSRRGYRSGGFNLAGDAPVSDRNFDPEYVIDVEAGVKSDWHVAGMPVRTNAAFFFQDYTDIQLPVVTTSAITGGPLTVVKNAGTAHIPGVEFEGEARPIRDLEVRAHFSWLDYEFENVAAGVPQPVIVGNIPKFKYGLSVRYYLPVAQEIGDVSVSADWNWQAKSFIAATNDPLSLQGSYGLLTLAADWRGIVGSPVDFSFFMTNATDQVYAIGGLPLTSSLGIATLTYGAPRMWGMRLTYRFGAER